MPYILKDQKFMDHYLVIGNPIEHSLSPKIHTAFAQQTQQQLIYEKLCVEPQNFFKTLDRFFSHNGKGVNITAPFKTMAFEYTKNHCSKAAKLSKAVNTLYLNPNDNKIWGDNTDGVGLLRDLQYLNWNISGKKVLILGSGGATRGILPALLSEKPVLITLYNRTSQKVEQLMQEFQSLAKLKNLNSGCFDFIFNTIPSLQVSSLFSKEWFQKIISKESHYYDLNYGSRDKGTPFINYARFLGCTNTADGLGMLIEQAAESFYIWRGIRPETINIKEHAARDLLNNR